MLGSRATYIIQGKNMYGIPKILQTRNDFDSCLTAAKSGEASAAAVIMHFRGLITSSQTYIFDKTLSEDEQPSGEMPEYCIAEQKDEVTAVVTRAQYKLTTDTNARIFELGYTIENVEQIIAELEELL